jgi:hypothetical protein
LWVRQWSIWLHHWRQTRRLRSSLRVGHSRTWGYLEVLVIINYTNIISLTYLKAVCWLITAQLIPNFSYTHIFFHVLCWASSSLSTLQSYISLPFLRPLSLVYSLYSQAHMIVIQYCLCVISVCVYWQFLNLKLIPSKILNRGWKYPLKKSRRGWRHPRMKWNKIKRKGWRYQHVLALTAFLKITNINIQKCGWLGSK